MVTYYGVKVTIGGGIFKGTITIIADHIDTAKQIAVIKGYVLVKDNKR